MSSVVQFRVPIETRPNALQCPVCERVWQQGDSPIHRVWCPTCLRCAVARERRRARVRACVTWTLEHLAAASRRIPGLIVILALLVLWLTLLYSNRYPVGLDSAFPPPPDLQR